ncbi:MAG: lipoyl synthase, partial [Gaiellales bacterium]|nr:lipoyl synthase [Gaiellales bacterium]
CPNIGECWGRGTATFQIMGDTCTRACRYCAVNSAKRGEPLDPLEPGRLAAAAQRMGLSHVVVTSVDRDDLDDRGAEHWARTIRALRRRLPAASVEVLTPDFRGREEEALVTVLRAHPHVFNHNIETVRRVQPSVRIKGDYDRALWLLRRAREVWNERFPARGPLLVKSGIVAGMGETDDEIVATLQDLRAYGVDVVTIGQYLQPTARHLPLDRWVPLDSFRRFREAGEQMGFGSVFSGPLVRSSYRAEEQQLAATGALRAGAL